jgi:hypothetical protein
MKNIIDHPIEKLQIKEVKAIPFNRKLTMSQVDKLLSLMFNNGILRTPVIAKTKLNGNKVGYYIIDGQHMLAALHKVDWKTVQCKVVETEDIPFIVNMMASLNNSSLKWILDDYVNAYATLCCKEYEKLRAHKLATGLNYAISSIILGESNHNTIKNGTFKATSKDVDKVTSDLIDVISFLGTNNSKFMKSFIKFRRSPSISYNHATFMQKLAQNKTTMKLVHDEAAMRNMLEDLYK